MHFLYYAKRIRELGALNTLSRIKVRIDKTAYKFYWKTLRYVLLRKALRASGFKENNSNPFFKEIKKIDLEKLKQKTFILNMLNSKEFQNSLSQQEKLENTFPYIFLKNYPTLITEEIKKNKSTFYQDIKIKQNKNITFDDYNFDIKVPWEISRFQHVLDIKNAQIFYKQVNNWIDQNPYLLGVNWVCPMDVAIRAINWIYGFYQFINSKNIPNEFWVKLINSLYSHAKYLENNWETSDKPNNHYLSDLLGHFYLCFFFDDLKHFKKAKTKTYKKILEQFDHQIQDDGTSYEGSTNYHKLVTEIFYHFYLLCTTNNIELPKTFYPQLQKMFLFLDDCTNARDNLVQIGDNDSGKILGGITRPFDSGLKPSPSGRTGWGYNPIRHTSMVELVEPSGLKKDGHNPIQHPSILEPLEESGQTKTKSFITTSSLKTLAVFIEQPKNQTPPPFVLSEASLMQSRRIKHYPNFGLSIIKNTNFHITFRHPTYTKKQPTGHFHQDELSITLSLDGIPILVDPGTYLYTGNTKWRNYFRSAENHNTFYIPELETNLENLDLFQNPRKEQADTTKTTETNNEIVIENYCNKYQNFGLAQFRKIKLNENFIEINDWFSSTPNNINNDKTCHWNLIFHPKVKVKKDKENIWKIRYEEKDIAIIKSKDLNFEDKLGYYSEKYGKIEKCLKLTAKNEILNLIKICIKKV